MKLLAFSDIHHNLMAVRKMRAQEDNSFDAIAVAGDIGGDSAAEFFKILASFKCPVLYVYGNWDPQLGYSESFGSDCHLLQGTVTTIGDLHFTGFSGCPTNWGNNPIARKLKRKLERAHKPVIEALAHASSARSRKPDIVAGETAKNRLEKIKRSKAYRDYLAAVRLCNSETLRLNRESVGRAVRKMKADPHKCIVMSHERIPRLNDELPGALLHLFGHIHRFSVRDFKGTTYVDVAALDRSSSKPSRTNSTDRSVATDAGNYTRIEITRSLDVKVTCMPLRSDDRAIEPVTRT